MVQSAGHRDAGDVAAAHRPTRSCRSFPAQSRPVVVIPVDLQSGCVNPRQAWEKMTSAGVVLRLDGMCQNFHPNRTGRTRHIRHTGRAAANLLVTALHADLAGP